MLLVGFIDELNKLLETNLQGNFRKSLTSGERENG